MSNNSVQWNSGFSLLESLVAFTVLSLVLVASFEVFGSGTKSLNASTEAIGSLDKLQNSLAVLQSGQPTSALDDDIQVKFVELQSEVIPWTDQAPVLVVLTHSVGETRRSIESIIFRKGDAQP